ncbi:hypothetical protein [Vreelandella olivaria]|uniref:hypothetical protein n=1 Tax=Vreelandella olivaria TaxID=390919 RepID=UPI00201E9213|nr:hypothetical protein [Halomonas olivaria]
MSKQRTNTVWAVGLLAVIAALGMLAEGEAEDAQRSLLMYCEGVAIWEAEKARGVPRDQRAGHLDWDNRIDVAQQCPGMRPALPALNDYAMPSIVPVNQIVQF